MKMTLKSIANLFLITLIVSTGMALHAQVRPYRVTDRQVQTLLDRIERQTNVFKDQVERSLDNSSVDGTRREDSINTMINNFENATDRLKSNFSSRRSTSADVQDVLNRAVYVNSFMQNNRLSRAAEVQWTRIRTDLTTLAGYYRVPLNWSTRVTPPEYNGGYTVSDSQMRILLDRLQQRSSAFRQSYERWSNQYDRPSNPAASYDISRDLTEFDNALNKLSRNYNNRNSNKVEDVLQASAPINRFVASNQANRDVTSKWSLVRTDLDTLASYYRVSWDWNDQTFPGNQYGSFDSRLTGTYRLNASRSDNVSSIVDRAIINANYQSNRRDRMRQNLERRLISPDMLSFEAIRERITMSTANGQTVTLFADGVAQAETTGNGRRVTTTVTATDRDLTINYEGDRINDYFVNFTPERNGQLNVTRRVYLEDQNESVTVMSVYDKISQSPQWNVAGTPSSTPVGININDFLVPNDTRMVATLDTPISTKTVKEGDRFTMTVTSPSEYYGAVIEGSVIGEKSGVVSGRAKLSLSLDSIRRGSRTYRFAGIIEDVRDADGDIVKVNNEGQIRDSSQTSKTVVRAGLGAAIGAIIGAIAGGGSGAAIGAGVGAGAGAGTVILQGRDNLELLTGSQITITATAPANSAIR